MSDVQPVVVDTPARLETQSDGEMLRDSRRYDKFLECLRGPYSDQSLRGVDVNIGNEPLVTLVCYAADAAAQDHSSIADTSGRSSLVSGHDGNGWQQIPNLSHRGSGKR